ncbi:uncharacterized protein LOC116166425 [Photinus pyralis]|uniref:uncharacterized protein LOC116166425 n=1 Tax=Photinus pyralis TaxID=7054 RepID=UPI0012671BAE|nr:uncharacterized protein LOC116166425 [Photinus pyralis]
MYRQIKLDKRDHRYHTVLWRFAPQEQIREYQLTTVTYGTASAPYLAVRTLQQLARDEAHNYPKAASVTLSDYYVDDVLTGANTIEEAKLLRGELMSLLNAGGFTLRKWAGNHPDLWKEDQRVPEPLEIREDEARTSLGMRWFPQQDVFRFRVEVSDKSMTKRSIMSDIAKIFDPLGLVSPVTITAKLLIQELWMKSVTWDQEVPEDIAEKWTKFRKEVVLLQELKIPRWIQHTDEELQLHGFCDASEKAYGAAVYTRSKDGEVTLLTSKTKVAPIKTKITIPKLKLCAAVLLARLLEKAATALEIPNITIYAWSDSTIALAWIKGDPNRWKSFVTNRVTEINKLVPHHHWKHVRTEENPADILSRGYPASKIQANPIWWNGPEWLKTSEWQEYQTPKVTTDQEMKRCLVATTSLKDDSIISRFSSLSRLLRVIAYCNRFSRACRKHPSQQTCVKVEELERSMNQLIALTQRLEFGKEIKTLQRQQQLENSNKLTSLNPFVDGEGMLRVGGRLHNSRLAFNEKHPIILPPKQQLTHLVIVDAHIRTLHGGVQLTSAYLRRKYWIINGKKAVKAIIHSCTTCIRYRKQTMHQLMGQLPTARVTPNPPFTHTGIDYAGPISIRAWKGRGHKAYKGYLGIFVCLSTKAIHLEAVGDLSTETFLAALRRFMARRGHCAHIYCDNGPNFVGASNLLQAEIQTVMEEVGKKQEGTLGIKWHFIPAATPHHGGLWEAGVKSVKHHLRRVIGEANLTYEELTTHIYQIEACLNSRRWDGKVRVVTIRKQEGKSSRRSVQQLITIQSNPERAQESQMMESLYATPGTSQSLRPGQNVQLSTVHTPLRPAECSITD